MNVDKESVKKLMFRFQWVDVDTIQIINKEGVEKRIDLKNNLKEIEYNIIPLYNKKEDKDPSRNFYTNRPGLKISQVLERLHKNY